MSYWKPWLVLVFLFVFAAPAPAQHGLNPYQNSNYDRMTACDEVEVDVRDSMGMAIANAVVTTENGLMPFTTDLTGSAAIPCSFENENFRMLDVRAPGYYPARIMMGVDNGSRLEVILKKRDVPQESSGAIINAQELSHDSQVKSNDLQNQALRAISLKNYDTAEKLLIQAHEVTPSNAAILNNLGVVETHRKDLNAAGSWFEKAMLIAPYNPEVVQNLGILRWMQHLEEESYQLMLKLSGMGYQSGIGNYIIGIISLEKGMNRQAADRLKRTSRDFFPYRDLYLSIALHNLGEAKAADKAYRSFFKRNPVSYALETQRDRRD